MEDFINDICDILDISVPSVSFDTSFNSFLSLL